MAAIPDNNNNNNNLSVMVKNNQPVDSSMMSAPGGNILNISSATDGGNIMKKIQGARIIKMIK